MPRIGNLIEKYSTNQNDRYTYFVEVIKEIQPFVFLSAFSISLSIFTSHFSPAEATGYAAGAGILFLLASFSLLCFKFIEPNFGLFLDISYLCTLLGILSFLISALVVIQPENFGDATKWYGAIFIFILILFISYWGYRNSKVDKLFKINVISVFALFFIAILLSIIRDFILYLIKIDLTDYQIYTKLVIILILMFLISLISLTLINFREETKNK